MDRSRIPLMAARVVSVMLAAAKVSAQQNAAAQQPPAQNTHKVAILVQSYPSLKGGGGVENVCRAMSYAVRLKKAGVEVAMIFDGPGLKWMSSPLTGAVEADKLPEETWNPSEDEKSKIVAMLINNMNSVFVEPEKKAKISRMLLDAMIFTLQRTQQQYWTPSPEENKRVLYLREELKNAGIPLQVTVKSWGKETAPQKAEKARSTEKGGLDIAAYVLDGYQVWMY